MGLEGFFQRGNKLVVFGSVMYDPANAADIDYSLFRAAPASMVHGDRWAVERFLPAQFAGRSLACDFSGAWDSICSDPYDLNNLPFDDRWLDGYFLTGKFFPDDGFLRSHYGKVHGRGYVAAVWKSFAEDVLTMVPNRETRMNKRHKDVLLLLGATRELAGANPSIRGVVEETMAEYNAAVGEYRSGNSMIVFRSTTESMIPAFISRVASFL
ncbi:TPA: hypothetical protein HA295_05840 [Candidatus Woesearchaeota archaeon]|nr:hypothetical protein [Candidatus Woesearchaeota archaeon]HII66263.1 hypothetical protein [Candidatus Woesearchaeota archaeon]